MPGQSLLLSGNVLCIAGALCLLLQTQSAAASTPLPVPTNNPHCVKFYDGACSEAIGAWLPGFGDPAKLWREAQSTLIQQRDGFVYENQKPADPRYLGFEGPEDGTFFVYGSAGPPRGYVVYDTTHRIVFYKVGCCSWTEVVAASHVIPPPKSVVARNLSDLHTVRGIRLGMRPTDVKSIYGASNLLSVPGHPDVAVLAYTTWKPRADVDGVGAGFPGTCGQFENFYFRADRLILIQLGNGC